ncbi:glycosyltransferase [Glutamicibacter creatinolyticus]|uniref:glycosyltransferase n=1 Tax=Glutamicibacter creatinolyticus TaxID=162496 RepID=UPI0037C0CB67
MELEQRYSEVSSEAAVLSTGKVKLEGLIARYERSSKKDAAELAQLKKNIRSLESKLKNETARAEKFKKAYDALRNHPVVRTARGLKSPFSRKPYTPAPIAGDLDRTGTALKQVNADLAATSERADGTNIAAQKTRQDDEFLQAVAQHIEDYRSAGAVSEPVAGIASLLNAAEIPSHFANMYYQMHGQNRLLNELPSVPPKTESAAYVPQANKVMYCAHSTGEFNSNGYSTRTTGLTSAVADAGYELFIAARPGYPWDSKVNRALPKKSRLIRDYQGVKSHFNPGVSLRDDPLDKFIQLSVDIYVREALMNRPAVISAASNHVTALPALIAARRLGIPFMYEVRGLWELTAASANEQWADSERFKLAVELETLVATEADQVFAITEEVREELVARGVERERIEILPNAANIFQYVPLPSERSRAKNHKRPGEYLLGYAGSLVGYEGLDLLVDAIAELPESLDHVGVLVAGDGAELAALRSRTERLGLTDRVRFVGRVPNDRVNDYLSIFDAVVCPRKSNQITELVSPLKPIEAMSAGRPVLGSDVAPIKTLLGTDSSRGLLFKSDDVQSLVEGITYLAENPHIGEDIGRRARQWTVKNRTWPLIAQTYTEAIRRLSAPARSTGKKLSDIRMALIADEFTTSTLRREVVTISPTPQSWRQELESQEVDVLFVESAWAGNEKSWTRKVGYYEDDQNSELKKLVNFCRSKGIPTVFWNKEDPVHFNRFRLTAKLFDVVLTTDANCLEDYWNHRGANLKALGSLPFWAQPEIHNPLASRRSYSHSVAYGGSYYGDRFAERSAELRSILEGVKVEGLTIYDRQADNPDSPYRFPASLEPYVQGGLSYEDMVQAYKSHPVHVNVNSVNNSPTMFSRRVFEISACGTPQISGKSFGVSWLFDGHIPVVRSRQESELISALWMQSERDRVQDAWGPLRVTFEKHLARHRLALALRMAGIPVEIPVLPPFAVELGAVDDATVEALQYSSLRPTEILSLNSTIEMHLQEKITGLGIRVATDESDLDSAVLIKNVEESLHDENLFEDLLIALVYSGASSVEASERDTDTRGLPLWLRDEPDHGTSTVQWTKDTGARGDHIRLRRVFAIAAKGESSTASRTLNSISSPKQVVVAGHDLKFAGQILEHFEQETTNLKIDQWAGHGQHDLARSRELIADADIIFCEWSLGNLVWYAKNKKPGQRLITRFHSQELFTDYPSKVDYRQVDQVVFVSELIRGMAIHRFGIPEDKTVVIPNPVAVDALDLPKQEDARFVLGLVGIVPQMKRFDLVLDLLEQLRAEDHRFTLRVKGKRPEEYPWMASREDEMAFYNAQYERIESSPLLQGAVSFDPHGDDMPQWYQGIGVAVSTSDFESFHFTLPDGAASGGLPVGIAWPGAEWIYPESWVFSDTAGMARRILSTVPDEQAYHAAVIAAKEFTTEHFNQKDIIEKLSTAIQGN